MSSQQSAPQYFMSSEETISQFLKSLGAPATPFNALSWGGRGTVATYMGLQVDIQIHQNSLLLAQLVVGYVPKMNVAPLLRHLLTLNSVTVGVYFCIIENVNAIVLKTSRSIEGLDFVEFKQTLDVLCSIFLQHAQNLVQTFQIPLQPG